MYVLCRYMYNGCMLKKILYENKYQRVFGFNIYIFSLNELFWFSVYCLFI